MIPAALATLTTLTTLFGTPEPRLAWALPAGAATVVGDTVAYWAPDFRSVLGVDARGRRLWRVATGDQGGIRDIETLGDNVLAYAGDEALLIAPKSGKVLGRQPGVVLGMPGVPGCRVEHHDGACAVSCACSFQPVRCGDLGAIGPRVTLPMFEEWDREGRPRSFCSGRAGRLVGRSGDLAVVEAPAGDKADPKSFGLSRELVALDERSGKERWRSRPLAAGLTDFDVELSGALADGHTCFLGARSGALRIFDCQRATVLWDGHLQVPAGTEPQVSPVDGGLVVRDGGKVARLSPSGVRAWEVEVPKTDVFVLAGDATPSDRRTSRRVAMSVLDPATGALRARVPMPGGLTRWPVPYAGGWIALGDDRLIATSARGDVAAPLQSAASIESLTLGPSLAALKLRDAISVRGLADARAAGLDGDRVIAVEGPVGADRVLVLKDGSGPWDPKDPATFGELRLFDLGPR